MPLRPDLSPPGWKRDLLGRLGAFWVFKMFGTTLAIAVFFAAYFAVLRHPFFPVTVMPVTAVDRWIGFQPEVLPFYLSLWVYVSLPPALLRDAGQLGSYLAAAVILAGIGLAVFFFCPTTVPDAMADWSGHGAIALLKRADAAGNACPSLHAAFAVFSACWLDRIARELSGGLLLRAANALWCAGILYSTIAVRQHVFLDALSGAVLGAVVALAHFRWLRREPSDRALKTAG